VAAILDGALKAGIIEKNGAWFSAGNTRVGQGRAKSLDFLRENEEFLAGIEAELLEKKKPEETPPEETPPEETPPEETPPEESGNGDKRKRPVTQKTKDKLSDVSVEDA
jgi:recombination protein RecA